MTAPGQSEREPVTVAIVNAKTGPVPLAMCSYVHGGWAGLQSAMRLLFINKVGGIDGCQRRHGHTHSCVRVSCVCVHTQLCVFRV